MSVIMDWGSAYTHRTPEVDSLMKRIRKGNLSSEEEKSLQEQILDIADTRKICVVISNEDNIACIRHIFRVADDAEQRLDELKNEYYQDYAQLQTDRFLFFTGYHRAAEFCDKFKYPE